MVGGTLSSESSIFTGPAKILRSSQYWIYDMYSQSHLNEVENNGKEKLCNMSVYEDIVAKRG